MKKSFFGLMVFAVFLPFLAYGESTKTQMFLRQYEEAMQAAQDGKSEESISTLKRLAAMGEPMSQVRIARLHLDGEYLPKDEPRAYQLFAKSAATGFPEAVLWQGYLLVQGQGISKDVKQGLALMEKAAQTGSYDAQFALCYFYDMELQDAGKAYYWCSVATGQANGSDTTVNAMINMLEMKLTPAQIPEIQTKAAAFKPVEWQYPADLFDK